VWLPPKCRRVVVVRNGAHSFAVSTVVRDLGVLTKLMNLYLANSFLGRLQQLLMGEVSSINLHSIHSRGRAALAFLQPIIGPSQRKHLLPYRLHILLEVKLGPPWTIEQ